MSTAPSHNGRIRLLPEQLANQIAAGEVVERPASVLKELLENALDAGASRIEVEVEKGGTTLIRVRDNGGGIHREDLPLAVSRHATSKIARLEDLAALYSLGFRGEALASIGSVSRLTLVSATADAEVAWSVEARGRDSEPRQSPASHPVGTSVEVAELFFNTPARRKFLRTEKTEFGHLEDVFKRAALSRFDVGFDLSHNRRRLYRLRPAQSDAQRLQRIAQVCGKAFADTALPVEESREAMRLHGWTSPAEAGRSSSDSQYFFLNGRMVRDKLIQHAIRQAYEGQLPEGRHAAYVLYLEMPAQEVDVNVHPTKHEVRFHRAREIHDFLVVALRRRLTPTEPGAIEGGQAARWSGLGEPPRAAYRPAEPSERPRSPERPRPPADRGESGLGRVIAQVGDRYLLLQSGEEIRLLDIAEADRLLARAGLERQLRSGAPAAALIFPAQVPLEPPQLARLRQMQPLLSSYGVVWDELTEGRIVLRALPEVLHALDLANWLPRVLAGLTDEAQTQAELALPVMAEAAAASRRYRPSAGEIDALLAALQRLDTGTGAGRLWRSLDESSLQTIMETDHDR